MPYGKKRKACDSIAASKPVRQVVPSKIVDYQLDLQQSEDLKKAILASLRERHRDVYEQLDASPSPSKKPYFKRKSLGSEPNSNQNRANSISAVAVSNSRLRSSRASGSSSLAELQSSQASPGTSPESSPPLTRSTRLSAQRQCPESPRKSPFKQPSSRGSCVKSKKISHAVSNVRDLARPTISPTKSVTAGTFCTEGEQRVPFPSDRLPMKKVSPSKKISIKQATLGSGMNSLESPPSSQKLDNCLDIDDFFDYLCFTAIPNYRKQLPKSLKHFETMHFREQKIEASDSEDEPKVFKSSPKRRSQRIGVVPEEICADEIS